MKGTKQDQAKRRALAEWMAAVNSYGGFGSWRWAVSKDPADVRYIIERVSREGREEVMAAADSTGQVP